MALREVSSDLRGIHAEQLIAHASGGLMAFDKCRQVAIGLWGLMRSNPPGSRCDDSYEPKWRRVPLFALALLLLAAGCGGGGEGTVPPPLTAGQGTLAPGVRALSDAENSLMVSSSLSAVVVSGSLNGAPGTVVMAKDSVDGATGVALSATRQRAVWQAATVGRHSSFPVAVAAGGLGLAHESEVASLL
jgi:hypothetical protein